jgi:HTH-type transcriptional regulator, sugar sensing transcriptional regulator
MDQDLVKILENVGFTEKEARIYLALLELEQGTVYKIAKIAELKRQIIYVILEGLMKRGYVTEVPNKKSRTFLAVDPAVILKKIKFNAKNFSEMLPILRTLRNKGIDRPKISYFENLEGMFNIYEEMNHDPNPFFITSHARLEKFRPGIINQWIRNYKRGLYQLKGRHLISDDPQELQYVQEFSKINQQTKTLSTLRGINMDFTIYGNKLAISCLAEKPFLVLIESEELVKSMRPIFEVLWEKGKLLD